MRNLIFIIHIYNALFILSCNIIDIYLRIIFLFFYFFIFLNLEMKDSLKIDKKIFSLVFIFVSIFTFSYLINGFSTIPNWDYYKYNKIMWDIFNNPLNPSVNIENNSHLLAYYYVIFMPSIVLALFLDLFIKITVFKLQFIFILLNTIFISYLLTIISEKIKLQVKKHYFLILIFSLGGLDYLFMIFNPEINNGLYIINDIQNGGNSWYYNPLRLQDFISYIFWLPAHTISALVALYFIIHIENTTPSEKEKLFITIPLVMFLFTTSIFSFFAFMIYMSYYYFFNKNNFNLSIFINYKTIVLVIFIGIFYTYDKSNSSLGMFLSLHIFHYGIYKYFLFFIQEFTLFIILGLVTKQKVEYYLTILAIILLSLFGSRDLLMSTSILLYLYLIYCISTTNFQVYSKKRKNVIYLIVILASPGILWNFTGAIDIENRYKNNMNHAEAVGKNVKILPKVLLNYTRKEVEQ